MIGLAAVVAVPLGHVRCHREEVVQHPQVRSSLISGDFRSLRAVDQRAGEESAAGGGVSMLGQRDVDDLPELVDRPVQIPSPASHLDVRLVDEPPVTGGVPAGPGGVGEQRREPLHPPVHRDVVDVDTSLGQQLLDVPVGQARSDDAPPRRGPVGSY